MAVKQEIACENRQEKAIREYEARRQSRGRLYLFPAAMEEEVPDRINQIVDTVALVVIWLYILVILAILIYRYSWVATIGIFVGGALLYGAKKLWDKKWTE